MDALPLPPLVLLLAVVTLLAMVFSNRRTQQTMPTVLYVPVDTRPEPRGSGCLPLLVLLGVLLVALSGLF